MRFNNPVQFAHAFASTIAVTWIVCSAFVLLFPAFSFTLTRWLFHGISILSMDKNRVTVEGFFIGGMIWVIAAWLFGYILAVSSNYFSKTK